MHLPANFSDQKAKRNILLKKSKANVNPSLRQYTHTKAVVLLPLSYKSTATPRSSSACNTNSPQPARVESYKIMLWGQYPALVDGPNDSYVDSIAYVIKTEQQQKMLEHYETDVYRVEGIRITVKGEMVSGRTFMWADDHAELTEGIWSLEE